MKFSIGEEVRVRFSDITFEGVVAVPSINESSQLPSSWAEGVLLLIDTGISNVTKALALPAATYFSLAWTNKDTLGFYVNLDFIEPIVYTDGLDNWI